MSLKIEILLIPLLANSHIFAISEEVPHIRTHDTTLDFSNALIFPDVSSRTELVTSPQAYAMNGAPRSWLGDNIS